MTVSYLYRSSLERFRVNRRKEIQPSAPRHPFVLQEVSSKRFRRENSKGLGLCNGRLFGTQYFFGPSCAVHVVSEFNPKHKLFQIRLIAASGILFVNICLYSNSTNTISITISLTFCDNC
jgi:hypothetical protein